MALENTIRTEVDKWNLDIKRPGDSNTTVNYAEPLRKLLYGIGIDIVEGVIDKSTNVNQVDGKNYLDLGHREAEKEFRKNFLRYHLVQNNFSADDTARAIGMARTALSRTMPELYGCTITEAKANPDLLKSKAITAAVPENIRTNLVNYAIDELKKYDKIVAIGPARVLKENSDKIADRLVEVALENTGEGPAGNLFTIPYSDAVREFKIWYITEQVKASNGIGKEAARRCGIDHAAFRQLAKRHNISVKETMKSGI